MDFVGYLGWWQELTQRQLPGNVGLPDELERWADELETAERPARQSFYHRNKDKIWVGVILTVATAIVGAVKVLVN
jgi:hypothetical protein